MNVMLSLNPEPTPGLDGSPPNPYRALGQETSNTTAIPRFTVIGLPRDNNEADIEFARVILISTEDERQACDEIERCRTAALIVLKEGVVEEVQPSSTTAHGFENPSLIAMKRNFETEILPKYQVFKHEMSVLSESFCVQATQMRVRVDRRGPSSDLESLSDKMDELEKTYAAEIAQFRKAQTEIFHAATEQLKNAITRYRGAGDSSKILVIANKAFIAHFLICAQATSFNKEFGPTITFKPRVNANSTATTSTARTNTLT